MEGKGTHHVQVPAEQRKVKRSRDPFVPNDPPVMAANPMQAWRWWRGQCTPNETALEELELSIGIAWLNESNVSNRRAPSELDGVAGERLTPLSDTDTSASRSPSFSEEEEAHSASR